ncbi:MAG: hypothetical protein ACO2PM_19510 [Pyrobaculum sp.]|jgi:hypothetical protein
MVELSAEEVQYVEEPSAEEKLSSFFIAPGWDFPLTLRGVEALIGDLVERVKASADAGGPIYPLLVTGAQGVGKSRLLAALAAELKRAGFSVWYDLDIPRGRYDYIILDDLGALITSWEWQTKLGRLLKKVEILIRNIGRWGYAVAAPRAGDILKNFRDLAKHLWLVSRIELKYEYGARTDCDVVAVYASRVGEEETLDVDLRWPLRGYRYCIKWSEFKWYEDPEWRAEYERVQSKREALVQRWLEELDAQLRGDVPEDGAEAFVRRAYQFAVEELGTAVDGVKALRAILENPQAAGLAFIKPRISRLEEHRRALEKALEKLEALHGEDAAAARAALKRMLEEDRAAAVVFAKSKLLPGAPREFLGARVSIYTNPYTKQREHGYAVPLAQLVELFIGE